MDLETFFIVRLGGGRWKRQSKAGKAQAPFCVLQHSRNLAAFKAPDFCCKAPDDNLALQFQLCQTHFIFITSYIRAQGSLERLNYRVRMSMIESVWNQTVDVFTL